MVVKALAPSDDRACAANVTGPAALLVAKLHKLGERQATPGRLADKDAHDLYRLLRLIPTSRFVSTLPQLARDELAGMVTKQALTYLDDLFAAGPDALGSTMAGRAEEGVGAPRRRLGLRIVSCARPPGSD
jgi:hypothetical protein